MRLTEDYSERMGRRTHGLENNVGWILFAVKEAAAVYYARRFQIWWVKSIRAELEEEED